MHRQSRSWLVVALVLAASLLVGLVPAAAQNWTPVQLKPQHEIDKGTVATHAKGQAQAPARLTPAMEQLQKEMQTAGIKPWQLPKTHFKYPAYKMLVDSAVKAGVKVDEAIQKNPESLCGVSGGWFNGPAMASNTNGTAVVYGGGMNLYFASASDPAHPTVIPLGDIPMRVYFQGNTAIVLGYFLTYAFDVTDPTQPALMGYDYSGFYYGFTAYGMTSDGQWIVGTYWDDEIVVWDSSFNYVTDTDLETLFPAYPWSHSPFLSDMTISGSVAIINDYNNNLIHFVDLTDVDCAGAVVPSYLGYIDDDLYGSDYVGQIMYQAPYLYTTSEPWWVYNPLSWAICPDNGYGLDIFSVPNVVTPNNFISVKHISITNWGNDLVAIRPAGNGNVALGLYNGRVAVWDAQFNTLLTFGIMGKFGAAADGYGWCGFEPNWEYFTLDMGYDATAGGLTANFGGGARFFASNPLAESSFYRTGDWAYNPIAAGTRIYTPEYVAGLAIVDNTDPSAPTTLGWLDTTPALPFIGLVAADGPTAYVAADYNTNYTKVFAADVSNPAAPAYIAGFDITADGYGTQVESLATNGGICWIGTDTSLVGVDFLTDPSAPSVVASFDITANGGSGAFGMTTFTMPAFPVSHFLAVAEGGAIELYDITSPTQYSGCPTPYFYVNFMTTGWATSLFSEGGYLFSNDLLLPGVVSTFLQPNISSACVAGEVDLVASSSLNTSAAITAPYLVAYAGTVGGHVVAAAADSTDITTIDVTDPTALAFLNATPQVVSGYYWGSGITGLLFANGALVNAGGWGGLTEFVLAPGFTPPTINSITAAPSVAGYFTGTITVTVNVTAADSAVTSVDIFFAGNKVTTVPTSIAAGATKDVTYTWNTSTWSKSKPCTGVFSATAYDSGCNESSFTGATTYSINLPPSVTLGNYVPAIPVGTDCTVAGKWIVCGDLTLTATGVDGACNSLPGISQMSLYVDGVFVTYINNPTGGVWDITLDTLNLSDGPHTLYVTATDAMGMTATSKTSPAFLVHNIGPTTVVTAPVSGNVVSGKAIRVAATAVTSDPSFTVAKVEFWLDDDSSSPLKLGTATTPDANGEYAIAWDSTATGTNTGYGNHTIRSWAFDNAGTCMGIAFSDIVSFNLVQYTPMVLTASATPTTGNIPLSVAFAANVTGGAPPFTYAWSFGDSSAGTGQAVAHTYATAGTFNWTVTVTDATAATATANGTITAINPVIPPTVTGVSKMQNPFRLKITGSNFHANCTIYIGGVAVPVTTFKSSSELVAKKGSSLKAMVPKGVPVEITVKNNDDGGVSAAFTYTR